MSAECTKPGPDGALRFERRARWFENIETWLGCPPLRCVSRALAAESWRQGQSACYAVESCSSTPSFRGWWNARRGQFKTRKVRGWLQHWNLVPGKRVAGEVDRDKRPVHLAHTG